MPTLTVTRTMQPADYVTFGELSQQGRHLLLDDSCAAALAATGLVQVRPEGAGRWHLLPNGKVGAVRIDNLQVQVTPKDGVGLTRLLFLLGYAANPGFRPEDATAASEPDLWAAIAESLARFAERATGRGVLQGYRTVEEAARTVRGRIRIGDQIARRPGLSVPLEVTYDEFTTDIAENQILRTAIRRMLGVPRLAGSVAARLAHIDGRLADVTLLRRAQPLPLWRPTRLNTAYQPALRLAEVILDNSSAETGEGPVTVAAFVVTMAKVFEDFVGIALTEALRPFPGTTRPQYPDHLDQPAFGDPPAIRLYPDVVHSLGGQPRIIFDAKYKVAGPNDRYPNADHYQMLAYCTALQVPTAWLVYAGGHHGGHLPRTRHVRNTGISIVEYPLDLSVEPHQLLAQVNDLADAAVRTCGLPNAAAATNRGDELEMRTSRTSTI